MFVLNLVSPLQDKTLQPSHLVYIGFPLYRRRIWSGIILSHRSAIPDKYMKYKTQAWRLNKPACGSRIILLLVQ